MRQTNTLYNLGKTAVLTAMALSSIGGSGLESRTNQAYGEDNKHVAQAKDFPKTPKELVERLADNNYSFEDYRSLLEKQGKWQTIPEDKKANLRFTWHSMADKKDKGLTYLLENSKESIDILLTPEEKDEYKAFDPSKLSDRIKYELNVMTPWKMDFNNLDEADRILAFSYSRMSKGKIASEDELSYKIIHANKRRVTESDFDFNAYQRVLTDQGKWDKIKPQVKEKMQNIWNQMSAEKRASLYLDQSQPDFVINFSFPKDEREKYKNFDIKSVPQRVKEKIQNINPWNLDFNHLDESDRLWVYSYNKHFGK